MPDDRNRGADDRLMTIAVTGATGFLGKRVVELLRDTPRVGRVRAIGPRAHGKESDRLVARLDRFDEVIPALQDCHALVHCAFDFYDMAFNLSMAETLAGACAAAGIRLVHISSAVVYEPFPDGRLDEAYPANACGIPYKDTKIAIERLLLHHAAAFGLDVIILQPTIIYGPGGDAWLDSPVRELLTGDVLLPHEGMGVCNPVFVDDVCQAVISALDATVASGERFLVSGPSPVAWGDFLGAFQDMLGTDSLRLVSGEELGFTPPAAPSGSHETARALRNLMMRRVARYLGRTARSRLNMQVQCIRAAFRTKRRVYVPSGPKLALYCAQCRIGIDKARQYLGYAPQFDLERGMAASSPYVKSVYAKQIERQRRRRMLLAQRCA